LINLKLKHICKVLFRGHIGYVSRPNFSEVMKEKIAPCKHVVSWSLQWWPSLLPMDGPLLLGLIFN
jgi:hypothetical protein